MVLERWDKTAKVSFDRRVLKELCSLRFIEARFRPAVNVSGTDIQRYYDGHKPALSKAHPNAKGVEDMKPAIEDLVAGEQVNKLLDEWLEQNRKIWVHGRPLSDFTFPSVAIVRAT